MKNMDKVFLKKINRHIPNPVRLMVQSLILLDCWDNQHASWPVAIVTAMTKHVALHILL